MREGRLSSFNFVGLCLEGVSFQADLTADGLGADARDLDCSYGSLVFEFFAFLFIIYVRTD
jgi:hypothetical protein